MKLKLNAEGQAVVQDGHPVYVYEDGRELPFDAAATVGTIARITDESKKYKERAQTAEAKAKAFEGIEDAEAARKAMETVKNLKDGELVTAGKVEEIKAAAAKAAKEQVEAAARASIEEIAKLRTERDRLQTSLYSEKIGGSFSRSKFIAEKMSLPGPAAQKIFGEYFKIEDGKIVARDDTGNPIYSRAKPGEIAEFDEALETLVGLYPYRDNILKGTGNSGSGARDGNTAATGAKTITRKEWDALSHTDRMAKSKDGVKVVDAA